MNILFINKFLYPKGGTETYMMGLGAELSHRGHRVEYFGMEHRAIAWATESVPTPKIPTTTPPTL